jgi:hypothetical protein
MPEFLACPEPSCGAPAEVVDRWAFASSSGPVPHVKTFCAAGHVFTPSEEALRRRQAVRPGRAAAG